MQGRWDRKQRIGAEAASGDYWRERICCVLPDLSIDWLEKGPVEARLKARRFADAGIVETKAPPIKVGRAMRSAGREGGYKLVLHLAGHGHYRYAGEDRDQAPGDLVLLDPAFSFEAVHPAGAHVLIWELERAALAPLLRSTTHHPWHVRGCAGMGAVLGGYARLIAQESDRLSAAAQRDLETHLCTLVALALGSPAVADESCRAARRSAQQRRVLAYIEMHLRDPLLTAERAADAMAISRRWLHGLLEESGESFSARLLRRRLEESRNLLSDRTQERLSIAEIGFTSGFNDVSTFHRRFRRYYGMTPREARREWLEPSRSVRKSNGKERL
jgi:AraC-like DNA-binding protein